MFKKLMAGAVLASCLANAAVLAADDVQENTVAKLRSALTLAQIIHEEQVYTLLVLSDRGDEVIAADLTSSYELSEENPLVLVGQIGVDAIRQGVMEGKLRPQRYERAQLIAPRGLGERHIAAGANYAEHGEEAGVDEVFLFPKVSPANRFGATVAASPGELLDYEVEVCLRFDRDIASMEDFEVALKGFFLCADFTERATLLRHLDPDDVTSGAGFPEAKSGEDRMPIGPYIVLPDNWRAWLKQAEIRLSVNGQERQKAIADEMILEPQRIIERALAEGRAREWSRNGQPLALLDSGNIGKSQAVLTGTPGGVIFREPAAGQIAWSLTKWLFTLSFIDNSLTNKVIDDFIEDAIEAGRYLQPGDVVEMTGTGMGNMRVTVVAN